MAKQWTTTLDFIQNGKTNAEIVVTQGFEALGDGGAASWQKTNETGLTPSQTPAQLGEAAFTDPSGVKWLFIGKALFIDQVGGIYGADNTLQLIAAGHWSNLTKGCVYIGFGTITTDPMTFVASSFLSLHGLSRLSSVIKLNAGSNDHLIPLSGTSELFLNSLTLDQDGSNQTAGHVIRSGGCNRFDIEDVLLLNGNGYGIGLQGGTSKMCNWRNFEISNSRRDSIDIKDFNLDNEVIEISNFTSRLHGRAETQQVALDVRGPINANGINIHLDSASAGQNRGIRLRLGNNQGRDGSGTISNVIVTGDGASDHAALDLQSASDDFVISVVKCNGVGFAVLSETAQVGGLVSGLVAKDCSSAALRLQGTGLTINGVTANNIAGAARVFDLTATASENRITNFKLTDVSGNPSAGRVQAGATNNAITVGDLVGGSINDGGANTDTTGLRVS